MDVVKKKENGDEVEEELFLYREEIDFNNIFYLILIDRIVKIFYFFILNYKIFLLLYTNESWTIFDEINTNFLYI